MKSLAELLEGWADGTLAESELVEFDRWLSTPEGRAQVVQEMCDRAVIVETLRTRTAALSGAIEATGGGRDGSEPSSAQVDTVRRSPRQKRGMWMAAASLLVALLGAGGYLMLNVGSPSLAAELSVVVSEVEDVWVEREGRVFRVSKSVPLRSGDIVRVGDESTARIDYRGESTWLELAGASLVEVLETADGKRISLRTGRLEAQVAPQPPGRPMICQTPLGRATVLGTHFCLTATGDRTALEVQSGAVLLDRPAGGPATEIRQGHWAEQVNGDIDVLRLGELGHYEAESLIVAEDREGKTATRKEQGKASGDYQRDFLPDRIGGSVTFQVPVEQAGHYRVFIGASKFINRGVYQLAISASPDGPYEDQGDPHDYFSASGYAYEEFDLGDTAFSTAGLKYFRFTCLGASPNNKRKAQQYGPKLGLDYLRLIAEALP